MTMWTRPCPSTDPGTCFSACRVWRLGCDRLVGGRRSAILCRRGYCRASSYPHAASHRGGVFVAANGFTGGPVDMSQAVEVAGGEDAVDRGWRDTETCGELHRSLTKSQPQADAAFHDLRHGLVRGVVWSRGAIGHVFAGAVAVGPALHGGPRDLEPGSHLADRPALVNDKLSDLQAVPGREGSICMGHDRTFGGRWRS